MNKQRKRGPKVYPLWASLSAFFVFSNTSNNAGTQRPLNTDKPDQAQVPPATVSAHSKRRPSAAWHSLHFSLCFRCGQRFLAHSQQARRTRLCSQSCIALQSLHWSFWRKCWQVEAPPHATHLLRTRLCSHIWEPPQALHWSFCRPCWQMDLPPHSLHLRLTPCQAVVQRCARDPQDAVD